MDLKRLQTFHRLAQLGSLTRAADALGTAQPALSRQIKLLEEDVGLPLFKRHSRGMELTHAGVEFLRLTSGPLRQIELSVNEVRELEGKATGEVALGLIPTLTDILAGRLAERIAGEFPEVSLRITEGYVPYLAGWLRRGDLDAAITYAPIRGGGLQISPLLQEALLFVGPVGSGLSLDVAVTFQRLRGTRLVLPSRASGSRRAVQEIAAQLGIELDVKVESDAYAVLRHLVAAGVGYTILPASAVAHDINQGRLAAAPLCDPIPPVRDLVLLESTERASSRATTAVLNLLKQEISALIQSGAWPAVMSVGFAASPSALS